MTDEREKEDELVGRVLARKYRIGKRLGAGGMGAVYEAIHLQLGRRVAVKTLLEISDPTDVQRLHDEALTAASLSHPCIVQVTDFGPAEDDDPPFLVMELLVGESLSAILDREGKLSVERATRIALQLLSALGAAHDARVLHRDVKPSNVFLIEGIDPEAPIAKVVDFGIAKFQDDAAKRTTTGKIIGTIAYMAPEVLRGQKPTASADIYAAGACLFEMLTGKRPFDTRRKDLVEAILREEAPAADAIEPRVHSALAKVVARALAKKPDLRFESAVAMADAIRAALDVPEPEALPPPRPDRAARPAEAPSRSRSIFAMAALASIAVGAIVIAVVVVRAASSQRPEPLQPAASIAPPPAPTDVPVPDASDAAGEPAPSEEPSAIAARPAGPKAVPAICFAGDTFLCRQLVRSCTCQSNDNFVLSKEHCPTSVDCAREHYRGFESSPHHGDVCSGFYIIQPQNGEPVPAKRGTGKLQCFEQCSKTVARAQAVRAVPGTPCEGLVVANSPKVRGVWKPIPDRFGM